MGLFSSIVSIAVPIVSVVFPPAAPFVGAAAKALGVLDASKAQGASGEQAWLNAGQSLMNSASSLGLLGGAGAGATNADPTNAYGKTEEPEYNPEPSYKANPAYSAPFQPESPKSYQVA